MCQFRIVIVVQLLFMMTGLAQAGDQLPEFRPGEVLVTLKSSANGVRLSRELPGVAAIQRIGKNLHRIRLQPDETVASMLAQLHQNPLVAHVQPNYIKHLQAAGAPDDPYYSMQWGLHSISAESAWPVTQGSPEVIVAVLDNGIAGGDAAPHPDLVDSLWHNSVEVNGVAGVDDDGNGCIDDLIGCDFSESDGGGGVISSGNPIDMDGHGTMVAGVIAAQADNGIAISGVSPKVKLMIIKAFNDVSSTTVNMVAAFEYAIAMGADIINASYGDPGTAAYAQPGFDYLEYQAIQRAQSAGILVVLPAGNGCSTADYDQGLCRYQEGYSNDADVNLSPYVPASYDLDNIIAVAASDQNDNLATFSNYGANAVDLAAPGVGIYSTYPGGGSHSSMASGTSMAAPFVTGTLALMLSIDGSLSMVDLKDRLLKSVDSISGLNGVVSSGGRLNVAAALVGAEVASSPNRRQPDVTGGGAGLFFLFLSGVIVCRVRGVGWSLS